MKIIRKTPHTKVLVMDDPGEGGACHEYICKVNAVFDDRFMTVSFQKGSIKENGVNGCQIEDLLAICIHRLKVFQSGDFACEHNGLALINIMTAILHLNHVPKTGIKEA